MFILWPPTQLPGVSGDQHGPEQMRQALRQLLRRSRRHHISGPRSAADPAMPARRAGFSCKARCSSRAAHRSTYASGTGKAFWRPGPKFSWSSSRHGEPVGTIEVAPTSDAVLLLFCWRASEEEAWKSGEQPRTAHMDEMPRLPETRPRAAEGAASKLVRRISRIRLSDKTSRLRPRLAAPTRGQA